MPEREFDDFRPARESSLWIIVVLVVLALAAGAVWWRWTHRQPAAVDAPPAASAPAPEAPAPAPAVAIPTEPQNPVDATADALPKLDDADAQVRAALAELLGAKAVGNFLQTDGFVRRFVATVDNLPREQAAVRVRPVQRMPGRFEAGGKGDAQAISLDNGARYTPFVLFAESVNPQKAAALYQKLYPLFQQAYEELGYPGRHFNDRLVAVIDHLLQAPEPAAPPKVKLVEIKGEVPSERPWVHYEFVDPQLQSLSAGQKMMVRVGLVNERRLKAKLRELRGQIAGGALAKKKS
ncbi:DUF3014 domain-containing protein [Variovorax sp. JS1663]|uniref:DUF3014 domain-containing protein n=1 Tax=Variovorax sp. JS1663 TaxID=1851577 RepID=UPI000B348DEA|nr:DUF3014 domain-containing protein [Variovorax sp. JS1663]OUL99055.1 hypothetical protein A8M77_28440 [Variovorax sp. JS1663]